MRFPAYLLILALVVFEPASAWGAPSVGRHLIESMMLKARLAENAPVAPGTPPVPSAPTVTSEPDNGLAAANKIKNLMRDHQMDQALAAAQEETQNHPDVALAWYSLGDVLFAMHRPKDAIPPLQKAEALNPRIGPTLFDLGRCLALQGQFDQAIDALTRAADQMPDVLSVWTALVQCLSDKHDPIEAERTIQGLLKVHPTSAYGWYALSSIQIYEQLPASAINSLQKAVALKPDFPEGWNELGRVYAKSQQMDKAVDCLARAAALRPNYDEALNNLGYSYFIMGQTDKAIETLKLALQANPKHRRALHNLTSAYAKEQQWALAKETCQRLAQINPQEAAELSRNFPAFDAPAAPPVQVATPTPGFTVTVASPLASEAPSSAPPSQGRSIYPSPGSSLGQTVTQTAAGSPVPGAALVSGPVAGGAPAVVASVPSAPTPVSAQIIPPVPLIASTPLQTAATPATAAPAQVSRSTPVSYDVAPPPSWVKPLDPDAIPTSTTSAVDGDVDYLLIDNQQLMDPAAVFSHYTLHMVNEEGLQTGSDIRAGFDPDYQTLTLHWLKVKRDGVWQDRLAAENFQILRREENLDSQMLDGRYSVVCHLQDVRVGDLVDFACTVKGVNPVFGGKFIDSFFTGFMRPVHLFSNQLVAAPNRTVFLKSFGGALEPTRTPLPDQSELIVWKKQDVPATPLERRTSEWYDSLGWVQISEFHSWKDVADWGLATFSLSDPPSPDLSSKIAEIAAAHGSPEDRALAAINFVQNDVRYLGVEMGANSYKPTPASQVFEHRFGDCKDKTQLCVVMLRALGIEAYPALVSTRRGAADKLLPSPLAFNHAIVQLTLDGLPYWIDVTRSGQRGRLQDFYVDDFKFALLLKPGADALVPMAVSPASLPRIAVEETFTVKSMTDPVSLIIHTIFKGRSAETLRATFNISSHQEMEKAYLDYYSRNYTQIKVEQPLRSQDFPDDNRFEIWQNYSISNFWTRDTATAPYKANFMPYSIGDLVGNPTPAPRTTPYRLDYPADISEDMEIQMFHRWHLDTTATRIDTPSFTFSDIPSLDDKTIHFKYHFETRAADVLPAGIEDYNEQINRIRDHLGRSLTYLPGLEADAPGAFRPNWMALMLIGLVFVGTSMGAGGFYFLRPSGGRVDMSPGLEQYEGIGGWLVLVCIGLAVGVFTDTKSVIFNLDIISDLSKWNPLTQPGGLRYDPYWAPLLLFEAICSVVTLVFLALVIVLLIQKRFTFPGVMIALFALNLIYHSIDYALASQVVALANLHKGTLPLAIFHLMVGCAIWIPYFLVSKRVKATFRY